MKRCGELRMCHSAKGKRVRSERQRYGCKRDYMESCVPLVIGEMKRQWNVNGCGVERAKKEARDAQSWLNRLFKMQKLHVWSWPRFFFDSWIPAVAEVVGTLTWAVAPLLSAWGLVHLVWCERFLESSWWWMWLYWFACVRTWRCLFVGVFVYG